MRIFVAGATGAIGVPAVRALLGAGHEVVGMTRDPRKASMLEQLGARPAVADALDAAAVAAAVEDALPDAIVQLLTALPSGGPMKEKDLDATNRLRIEGTANLLRAARAYDVGRYVSESIVLGYGPGGDHVFTEDDPFAADVKPEYPYAEALRALSSLEQQVLAAEGIVLRFGLFYGSSSGSTQRLVKMARAGKLRLPRGGTGVSPWIHLDDAAAAVVAAVERGTPGRAFNIVDDEPAGIRAFASAITEAVGVHQPKGLPRWIARLVAPYLSDGLSIQIRVSNARAKAELDWTPRYPTYREGVRTLAEQVRSTA